MADTGYREEELLRLVRSQLLGTARPRELSAEQKRLITQFRLVRNGLGNYGGHGDTIDYALLPAPTIAKEDGEWMLTFAAPLPAHAVSVFLWYPGPHGPTRDEDSAADVCDLKLSIARGGAALVEIADLREDIIAAGVPINKPAGYHHGSEISSESLSSAP